MIDHDLHHGAGSGALRDPRRDRSMSTSGVPTRGARA